MNINALVGGKASDTSTADRGALHDQQECEKDMEVVTEDI